MFFSDVKSNQKITNRARMVLLIMACLLLLSYGFMQIRIASVPLAEITLLLFLMTANLQLLLKRFSYTVNPAPFFFWWLFGLSSAFYYFYLNGIWALRDATNIIESLYILVGFSLFSFVANVHFIVRKYPVFLFIACVYALSYPFGPFLQGLSPRLIAGAGHSVPILFSYTNSAMMLLMGALFLSVNRSNTYWFQRYSVFIAAFILLLTIGFFQARTIYLQIVALIIILSLVNPSSARQWVYIVCSAIVLLFAVSVLGIEIEGRLGQKLSVDFLFNHFMAIFGVESSGLEGSAAGVGQRTAWWLNIYDKWSYDLSTMLFGLGFGFPLIDFTISQDVMVREPHNSYISVLARSGLIGFSLWLWMHWYLLKAWRFSYQACKRVKWQRGETFLIVLLGYFVMIWVLATGQDGFEKPYNAVPYYFFWGIVLRIFWFSKQKRIDGNGII